MRIILISFLFIFQISLVLAQRPSYGGKIKPLQANMDIKHYSIHLLVDIPEKKISGFTVVKCKILEKTNQVLLDLMDSLIVTQVLVNDVNTPFTHRENLLGINSEKFWEPGIIYIKVFYSGHPMIAKRPPWDDGFTFTHDSTGHPWVAVTAEGTGGKIYFPAKDHPSDEPDEGAELVIQVPKGLVVAGPGMLKSIKNQGKLSTFDWVTHYPINNYSIVFNIGDYEVVKRNYTTIKGNKVPMQFYVLKEHASMAPHLLEIMEESAHVKEKYLGEYPWAKEKIGLVETPHLGMEHQTMNAYGNKFRYVKVGGKDFDWLMNHEFGHEWWGNKVTAGDWADYWIHEGIGTFSDALYTLDMEGEEAYEKIFKKSAYRIKNDKPIVLGKDIEEQDAYHPDIYPKGGFFIHTLRFVLGDSIFFPALKGFATDSAYTYTHTTKTEDFMKYFDKASGKNLDPLFHLYLYTTDKLDIRVLQKDDTHYLVQTLNLNMDIPLEIRTDTGLSKKMVNKKGILIESKMMPMIDEKDFYLKRVLYE
jgi:aminopeptidase N